MLGLSLCDCVTDGIQGCINLGCILATTLGDVVLTTATAAKHSGSHANQGASLHAGRTCPLGGCHQYDGAAISHTHHGHDGCLGTEAGA